MNPLQVAIVDDEPLARTRLRRLLGRVGHGRVQVVAECVDVEDLLETAADVDIDVLFLDIEMPGDNGFGALARWRGPRPQVVFVTAYPQHGVRAFDVRAVDYLVKPVAEERLRDTLGRLGANRGGEPDSGAQSGPGPGSLPGPEPAPPAQRPLQPAGRLPLKIGRRTHLVAIDRIDLVLAQGNYLQVHAEGAIYAVRSTLAEFQQRLDDACFVRVHRSAVVRIAAIRHLQPTGSARYHVVLHNGQSLYSGRRFHGAIAALTRGPAQPA